MTRVIPGCASGPALRRSSSAAAARAAPNANAHTLVTAHISSKTDGELLLIIKVTPLLMMRHYK